MNNNVSRKEKREYENVDPGILASSSAFGGRRTKLKKSKKSKNSKKSKKIRKIRTTQRR